MARRTMGDVEHYTKLANSIIQDMGIGRYLGINIAYDAPANKRLVWLNHENTGQDDSVSCERVSTGTIYDVVFSVFQVLSRVNIRMREHADELLQDIPEHQYMRRAAGYREREVMRNLRIVRPGCSDGVYRLVSWSGTACEWYPAERTFIG